MKNNKSWADKVFREHWPYWVGGLLLAVLNIALTYFYKPWGITGGITDWGMQIWSLLGGQPEKWDGYFREVGYQVLAKHPIYNEEAMLNLGLIAGVLLAAALSGQLRIKTPRSPRQIFLALAGGILMGYGARLALGCNIGAMVGGIASQSLHGWIAGIFLTAGALAGSIFLRHYFIRTR